MEEEFDIYGTIKSLFKYAINKRDGSQELIRKSWENIAKSLLLVGDMIEKIEAIEAKNLENNN